MKILKAERRFFFQHRVIRDVGGEVVGFEIQHEDDPRTRRAPQCGSEGNGYIVAHAGRNRARRRELARAYKITGGIAGTNKPLVKDLNRLVTNQSELYIKTGK